jgi:hypothetical protein
VFRYRWAKPHGGQVAVLHGEPGAYLRKDLVARLGRRRVDAEIRHGQLRRLWTGVLIDSTRQLDVHTRAAAALLLHGPRSVISGPTAAWLHGCTGIDSANTHVTVPYEHRTRGRPGLVVHNGSLSQTDIVELAGLRVFCLDRVVCDLLCTARARDAIAVADQALALQGSEQAAFRSQLSQRLAERPDPRGTRRGAWLLGLATGRAESPPESWLLLEVVNLGFPVPKANWPLCSPDGVLLYRLDLAWPEQRIALEYDGYATHVARREEDQHRMADLERRGWIVIPVTRDDLRDNMRLERVLRDAFQRRGYSRPG